MQAVYETDRLILKVLDESFAEQVLDYFARNKVLLQEWESTKAEDFYTQKFQEEQLVKEFLLF